MTAYSKRRWTLDRVHQLMPEPLFHTLTLLGIRQKIPLVYYVRPSIVAFNDEQVTIRIPLNQRTRNHLDVMYFGALGIGSDCVTGFFPLKCSYEYKINVPPLIKRVQAEFFKQADGDAHFTCTQGKEVEALFLKAAETGERVEMPLKVVVTVPDKYGEEPVAEYTQILSMKKGKSR